MYFGVTIREKGRVVFEGTITTENGITFYTIKNNIFWTEYIRNLLGKKIKVSKFFNEERNLSDILSVLIYLKDIGVDIKYKVFAERKDYSGV